MPSVRYGQLAGFTFALQNGLFLWFGQWNLRERVGRVGGCGVGKAGGQGGCGVGCVLVDDDVHPLHEPTRKGGALLVAVEQELLEVAPVVISEHLRKQVSTCLLTHVLTHCPLTCCKHLRGWHLVLEEHLEEEEMHLGPSGVRVRVGVGVGVGGRARLRERLGTVELAHEDEEATRGDGEKATRGGALLVGAVLLGLWLAVMVIDLGLGHARELELPGARLSQLRRLPTEAALACGRKRRVDRWGRLWRGRCGDGEGGGHQRAHVLLCGRPRAFGRRPLRPGLRLPLDLLPVVVEGALLDAAGALPRVGDRVVASPLDLVLQLLSPG